MDSAWEAIFMLLVLKIPLVYLGVVIWWAIRAEPVPGEGSEPAQVLAPLTPCNWDDWKRRRGRVPRPLRPSGPRTRSARVGASL